MLINDDSIVEFLDGNASCKEILEMKNWLKDDNHRVHYENIWKIWILTSHKEITQDEVDKAFTTTLYLVPSVKVPNTA